MAAPASSSVPLQFPSDVVAGSCVDDPNFATICSFIQNFGEIVRIGHVPFDELQQWLESRTEVPVPLIQLHLTLLRRVFKTVSVDKWERSLSKFGHMYCSQDGWEIERYGYKMTKIQTRLRLLKNLCEAQFDFNVKFKAEVNKLQAADLRLTPLGRDTEGQVYWYQVDADANLRVYREDIDDETWEIVASTKEELVELISQLQRGEVRKPEAEEAIILPEEDSNSKDGIEPKEIILDTGKVEEDDSNDQSADSEEIEEKPEVKKVEPLLLRNVFSMNKLQHSQLTIVDKSADNKSKEEGGHSTMGASEIKPGIKLVFGMKSKATLDSLFPPPTPSESDIIPSKVSNLELQKVDNYEPLPEDLSLAPSASAVVCKSESLESRTPRSPSRKDNDINVLDAKDVMEKQMVSENVQTSDKTVKSAQLIVEESNITHEGHIEAKTEAMEISSSEKHTSIVESIPLNRTEYQAMNNKSSKNEVSTRKPKHMSKKTAESKQIEPSNSETPSKVSDRVDSPEEERVSKNKSSIEELARIISAKVPAMNTSIDSNETLPKEKSTVEQTKVEAMDISTTDEVSVQETSAPAVPVECALENLDEPQKESQKPIEDANLTKVQSTEISDSIEIETQRVEFASVTVTESTVQQHVGPISITEDLNKPNESQNTVVEEIVSTEEFSDSNQHLPEKSSKLEDKSMETARQLEDEQKTSPLKEQLVEPTRKLESPPSEEADVTNVKKSTESVSEVEKSVVENLKVPKEQLPGSKLDEQSVKKEIEVKEKPTEIINKLEEKSTESTNKIEREPSKNICNFKVLKEKPVESMDMVKELPENTDDLEERSPKEIVTSHLETAKSEQPLDEGRTTLLHAMQPEVPSILSNEPVVPEADLIEQELTEVKEVVEKSDAWVCGQQELPAVVEKIIIKEKTWVCGKPLETKVPIVQQDAQHTEASATLKDISPPTEEIQNKQEDQKQDVKPVVPVDSKTEADITDTAKSSSAQEAIITPSVKANSSLVSALYSESSESSNEATDLTPKSPLAKPKQTDLSSGNDFNGKAKPETTEDRKTTPDTEPVKTFEKQEESTKSNVAPHDDLIDQHEDKMTIGKATLDLSSPEDTTEAKSSSSNKVIESNVKSAKTLESETSEAASDRNPSSPISIQETLPEGSAPSPSSKVVAEEDRNENPAADPKIVEAAEIVTGKRKAEEDIESVSKMPRLEGSELVEKLDAPNSKSLTTEIPFNPIVGETIEEEVMTIVGEGSGAANEGSNENSPVPLAAADVPGSHDESIESEESRDAFPTRGRGGRRGRGRRGRPSGTTGGGRSKQPSASAGSRGGGGGGRGLREVARLGVSVDSLEVNGENDRPVRASRRIAQIRLKEEEERRKLEEERLAQLKAAQMQKKAKQEERDKKGDSTSLSSTLKGKKGAGKKSFKDALKHVTEYIPDEDVSESEDNSEDEGSDEFSGKIGKKRKHRRKKNGKPFKKGGNPWATSSDEEEEAVEEEEEYHYEEEEEELVFKSDHEFSPESDLGEDGDAHPSRHARTAKQDKGSLFEEGNCCKCGKGDHPEWILLCDKCDKGWHASCLRPQLWVIPEGEWFCPPCQHNMLIENLSKNLVEYEVLLKKRENEILRKQRLAYVGISLDNVLPDKDKPEDQNPEEIEKPSTNEKRKPRRRILSDEEELSDDFINDRSDDGLSAESRTNSSDDSDEPAYRLRARRTKKAFNFKEYDDMINSALQVDDEEEGEVGEAEVAEGVDLDEDLKVNGENEECSAGGGKNDAYLKHLEEQAQEEDETDEELLDEKERLRRRELKKSAHRKTKRRINDLDAYSDEEDSDDDFKASEAEDDEEELGEDGESEWSGDKGDDDSDDSIAKRARRKGRHGRLGRREKYSDKGLVRRSTRKRRSRISYDESDDDDEEEEDQNDKWQSEEEVSEESESNSESDDSTWGKRKKKALAVPKSSFFSDAAASTKGKGKCGIKRKKRKTDGDDVDRAWNNSARNKKPKDEPIERRTRGRKINFKDILDSGESDDEGNVRPKRRPLSDSDDSRSPSSSRKLAEEIRAENARKEKEYEESQAKKQTIPVAAVSKSEISEQSDEKQTTTVESLVTSKLVESGSIATTPSKIPPSPVGTPLSVPHSASPVASPIAASPVNLPPSSSPLCTVSIPSPLIPPPPLTSTVGMPPSSSPVHIPPPLVPTPPITPSSALAPLASILSHVIPPLPTGLPKSPSGLPFPITASALSLQVGLNNKGLGPLIIPPVPVPTPEKKSKSKSSRGSRGSKSEKQSPVQLEMDFSLSKQVKTSSPPPPVLTKSSSKKRDKESPTAISVPNPALLMAGGGVSLPDMLSQTLGIPTPTRSTSSHSSSSSKKGSSGKNSSSRNPSQQTTPPPISQNLSPSLPVDIDRVPNPALFQANPGIRSFHSMWMRPGLPPPGYGVPGSPVPSSLGKPPPLNASSPFPGSPASAPRPGFPSPPSLRIPNPNTSPLQAFHNFKRDGPLAGALYRLPPGQPQSLANILPPGMIPQLPAGAERFFGPPTAYGHPYGLLPPHAQGQHPQALFPYDYRPPDAPFKEEPPPPPRTSASSLPTPVSSASSSPPPSAPAAVPSNKEEGGSGRDSEFGGLVSYFSSQRSEEDMDT